MAAVTACKVTLEQINPGLPPKGAAGGHEAIDNVVLVLHWFQSDPQRCRKRPEDVEQPLPNPKVMVRSQEFWDELGAAFVELGMCRVLEFDETATFDGELVLAGMFGVHKPGAQTETGKIILRLIMDFRVTNAFLVPMNGDMGKLPTGSSMLRTPIFLS